ncbi:MAG: FAD-binding oxidoreductase [Gammaproteobacteria bacterium]|nr:FAD-binding oxidoreductase [Gammaproteobacteria bacterium]
MTVEFDIVVVGAGIAGSSAAAELAANAKVLLLDMEAHPGFHATGRSAAFFAPSYGNAVVRGITAASEHFYRKPPEAFSKTELIRSRDTLFIARNDQLALLKEMENEIPLLSSLSGTEACSQVPILDHEYVAAGLSDGLGGDLDVDAILQGYLRLFKKRGGQLMCRKKVEALHYNRGVWSLQTESLVISTPILVNAAGAWADVVAELAGVTKLGLQPMKRTAVLIDPNQSDDPELDMDISNWPLVVDVEEQFYFKPGAGQILVSPADETPCDPCDAQPDEIDIAIAIDRFQKATSLGIKRVSHSWSGLRTFAPDRNFVVGFDPRLKNFFWLAGQGGYGVQAAPGIAQLANSIITGATLTQDFSPVLNYQNDVTPERLIK